MTCEVANRFGSFIAMDSVTMKVAWFDISGFCLLPEAHVRLKTLSNGGRQQL